MCTEWRECVFLNFFVFDELRKKFSPTSNGNLLALIVYVRKYVKKNFVVLFCLSSLNRHYRHFFFKCPFFDFNKSFPKSIKKVNASMFHISWSRDKNLVALLFYLYAQVFCILNFPCYLGVHLRTWDQWTNNKGRRQQRRLYSK